MTGGWLVVVLCLAAVEFVLLGAFIAVSINYC